MPKLIISSHLVAPLVTLYDEYSDMHKDCYNHRPSNWDYWVSQVGAADKLRAEIDHLHRRWRQKYNNAYGA